MKKLILKGVLLWVTALSISCFLVGGLESLMEDERWFIVVTWLVINIILSYLCYHNLSYKDCYKLSGCQWFDSITERFN